MSHIRMTGKDIADVAEFSGPSANQFTALGVVFQTLASMYV